MVSSIVPGATSANALGVEPRYARNAPTAQRRDETAAGDRVELSGASIAAARESVRDGISQIQEALALGHEAQSMLVQIQAAARNGSQDDLNAALNSFAERLQAAIDRGARLVSGDDINVQAEPGGAAVVIEGADLRLKAEAEFDDILSISADASVEDPGLPQAVQKSLEKLQEAMTRLLESVRALEAHQGFLGAAESAAGVRSDLDADTARLLALQVRQGLEAAGASPIANVEPQAVLSLFRA
jgi:hypothetical protein